MNWSDPERRRYWARRKSAERHRRGQAFPTRPVRFLATTPRELEEIRREHPDKPVRYEPQQIKLLDVEPQAINRKRKQRNIDHATDPSSH